MSNTKHTPGPWFLSPQKRFIRADGIHGWNVASIEDQPPFTEANAKLIAAAPELLDELVRLKKWVAALTDWSGGTEIDPPIASADAVIKKATE